MTVRNELTPEIIDAIVSDIAIGIPKAWAAEAQGVSRQAFYSREIHSEELRDRVMVAQARAFVMLGKQWLGARKKDGEEWTSIATWMQRSHRFIDPMDEVRIEKMQAEIGKLRAEAEALKRAAQAPGTDESIAKWRAIRGLIPGAELPVEPDPPAIAPPDEVKP